jgi:hypothetical protein
MTTICVLGVYLPVLSDLRDGWFLVAHPNGPGITRSDILSSLEYPDKDIPEHVRSSAIRQLGKWAKSQPTWPRIDT